MPSLPFWALYFITYCPSSGRNFHGSVSHIPCSKVKSTISLKSEVSFNREDVHNIVELSDGVPDHVLTYM